MPSHKSSPKKSHKKSPKKSMSAYCLKCKEKRSMKNPKLVRIANGRHALQCKCPVCGTKMSRFVSKE